MTSAWILTCKTSSKDIWGKSEHNHGLDSTREENLLKWKGLADKTGHKTVQYDIIFIIMDVYVHIET